MSKSPRERSRDAVRDAVAHAGGLEAAAAPRGRQQRTRSRASGRRREVLPLLVLHFIAQEPSYGNQLMERISGRSPPACCS